MESDLIATISIVGSIASIIGIFLPAQNRRARAIHVVYGIVITVLAAGVIWYKQETIALQRIERQASQLVASHNPR